jgi:hypothetical protein
MGNSTSNVAARMAASASVPGFIEECKTGSQRDSPQQAQKSNLEYKEEAFSASMLDDLDEVLVAGSFSSHFCRHDIDHFPFS